ncbi:MAG: hypothetical protein ACLPN1_03150 [Dissulfurispiraceae bacterium]
MILSKKSTINDEQGFVFIVSLLAMLILISLSVLMFALTTRDVRVTIKLMGEKTAFSAAENGIQALMQSFDPLQGVNDQDAVCPGLPGYLQVSTGVSGLTTASCYNYTSPAPLASGSSTIPMAGYSITGSQQFGRAPYFSELTGANTNYMSQVVMDVGIGYGPVNASLPSYQ